MTIHKGSLAVVAAATLVLGGCVESQRPEATGKGSISALHSIAGAADVTFLIEERSLGDLSYKAALAAQRFDDLTYDFNFDGRVPGSASRTRLATQTISVVPDTAYVLVLTGTVTDPSVVVWESEERQWGGDETVTEVSAGHLAGNAGPLDIYLEPPGTAPAAGNARGTLSFGEKLPPFEVENGDYRLIVTAQDDPSTILFTSGTQDLSEQNSYLFAIRDPDPSITSSLSVRRTVSGSSSVELAQLGTPPTRRWFNAAFGSGNVDLWLDDDFTTPIVSDLPYGAVSADIPVPSGTSTYTVTAAGNPGAVLHEDELAVAGNTRGTAFLAGEAGDLDFAPFVDDRRPFTGLARVRLSLLSANAETVDGYLVREGVDIADSAANLPRLPSGGNSNYLALEPNVYELTITVAGEKTVLAGPLTLDLGAGEIVETAVIDTADPNALQFVTF